MFLEIFAWKEEDLNTSHEENSGFKINDRVGKTRAGVDDLLIVTRCYLLIDQIVTVPLYFATR